MLLINILGVVLIVLIVWWFWLYKPPATRLADRAEEVIVENGVYLPARVKIPAHTPTSIRFLRKDASPCAAMVQFPDLEISEELPVNKAYSVDLPALEPGEYPFTCQMQMYRGTLLVE